MQYLFDNKIYDTEKSKLIIKYIASIETSGIVTTYPRYEHSLYKSSKGQFFVHVEKYKGTSSLGYHDKDYIKLLSETSVKRILNELNAIEEYKELFNDLEEG